MTVDRSAIGRRSRGKGQAFELTVRDRLTEAFVSQSRTDPDNGLTIRRSSQAERAYESDLIIEGPGVPQWLCDLWVECEHANVPDPWKKLEQAKRDAGLAITRTRRDRMPIVVWRETGKRIIWLSTTLPILCELVGGHRAGDGVHGTDLLVTVELGATLDLMSMVPEAMRHRAH
jgi:hypothetical protein